MRKLAFLFLIISLTTLVIGASKSRASGITTPSVTADGTMQIMVEVNDGMGSGGDDYLPIQPLAHEGSLAQHTAGKVLISAYTCDYTVTKDSKFIKAKYILFMGSSSSPVRGTFLLPIQSDASKPIDTPLGGGFSAFAVLVKK